MGSRGYSTLTSHHSTDNNLQGPLWPHTRLSSPFLPIPNSLSIATSPSFCSGLTPPSTLSDHTHSSYPSAHLPLHPGGLRDLRPLTPQNHSTSSGSIHSRESQRLSGNPEPRPFPKLPSDAKSHSHIVLERRQQKKTSYPSSTGKGPNRKMAENRGESEAFCPLRSLRATSRKKAAAEQNSRG